MYISNKYYDGCMAGISCRSVILRIKFLLITLKLFFLSARSCSFAFVLIAPVRGAGDLGPDGVLEVSSVMVIMAEMVIKVAMVNVVMMVIVMVAMVVMLVMTKNMLKSNHDNVL